jgi:Tol biopolymer transport system component
MPSELGTRAQARSDLTDSEVRAQLGKILASEVFSRSPQLRRFLSFVVEQRLSAQGHTLKESVLAHELYGKGTDFDGGTDPVVRVDARRLRDKLREYYEGSSDPVVISLPKGTYVPVFSGNSQPEVQTVSPDAAARLSGRWSSNVRQMLVYVGAVALIVVAVTVAIAWRGLRQPVDRSPQFLPLASYPGVEGPPSLSPDGSLVAFAWSGAEGDGPTDIYVKAIGSEALRPLTQTPNWEGNPAWSPDGHSIAFVRNGEGVFIVSQLGGTEQRVSASGTHVAWASDSKSVLIRDREGKVGPRSIYQVFLDTLERRRLTQPPFGDGDWRFEVSPDGTTLAFIRYGRTGIADLYVVPMRGGEPRRLSDWNAVLTGLSWTPDGQDIVYSVEEAAANRLWRIHANSAQPGRGVTVRDIPVAAGYPSISRPSPGQPARLAFQTISRDVDIHLVDLEASVVNEIIPSKPFAKNSTQIESSPRFSPDAGRIAFVSKRSGSPEIWVASRDGNGLRQITWLGATQLVITGWSPDGAQIGFDAAIAGNSDVYVVGSEGGNLRRLTRDPAREGLPSWSGDGRWIYFTSTRAGVNPDIWRMTPDGGQATRITRNGGFDAKESPDGQSLYYLDHYPGQNGTARLMRAGVDGGQESVVLDGVRPLLWSVTNNGIVFVTRESDFDALDVYRFSDQLVARLGRLGFRIPSIYTQMAVSRDGRWALATEMVRFDADLMLLDNFQ